MGVFATSHVCFKHTSNTVYKQNKNVLCGLTTHLECAMHVFLDLPKNDLLALDAFYLCTAALVATILSILIGIVSKFADDTYRPNLG